MNITSPRELPYTYELKLFKDRFCGWHQSAPEEAKSFLKQLQSCLERLEIMDAQKGPLYQITIPTNNKEVSDSIEKTNEALKKYLLEFKKLDELDELEKRTKRVKEDLQAFHLACFNTLESQQKEQLLQEAKEEIESEKKFFDTYCNENDFENANKHLKTLEGYVAKFIQKNQQYPHLEKDLKNFISIEELKSQLVISTNTFKENNLKIQEERNKSDIKEKQELVSSGQHATEEFINKQTNSLALPPPNTTETIQTELLKKAIESRKITLAEKRTSYPEEYPSYLENLLEKGYIHLYDHLLDMKELPNRVEREKKIRTLPFSEISHIILETRQAIINAVSISPNKSSLFIVGLTGSGKSTTLCFLRGDEMEYNDRDGEYLSKNSQSDLIGHHSTRSCTFLPNTEELEDLTIVDYPGFEDTNGSLVALGVECAFKFFTYTYQPKILVIESITNTDGRYTAVAKLGRELKRLLGDLSNCILGITKYSRSREYLKLKEFEVKKSELQKTIQELDTLSEIPQIRSMKEARKAELAKLENPDPSSKALLRDLREKLEKEESNILSQIGLHLTQKISLVDLEDPQKRRSILRRILEIEKNSCHTIQQEIDSEHVKLLSNRFREDIIPRMKEVSFEESDVNNLERKTLESSLINALFFKSCPEIGKLFHLPEMDPMIVQKLSEDALKVCKNDLMDRVIKNVNFTLVSKMIEHSKANSEIIAKVRKKQDDLKKYILYLRGEPPITLESFEDKWNALRNKMITVEEKAREHAEQENKMSLLENIGGYILLGIPFWLNKRAVHSKTTEEIAKSHNEICEEYFKDLDCAFEGLTKLQGMECIIGKKKQIQELLQDFSPSFQSLDLLDQSITKTISELKNMYGAEQWNKRVDFLKEKFSRLFGGQEHPLYLPYGEAKSTESRELERKAVRATAEAAEAIQTGKTDVVEEALKKAAIAEIYAKNIVAIAAVKTLKKAREEEEAKIGRTAALGATKATVALGTTAALLEVAALQATALETAFLTTPLLVPIGVVGGIGLLAYLKYQRTIGEEQKGEGDKLALEFTKLDDVFLTLFLGQNPYIEVIKISGTFSAIQSLCNVSNILNTNALLFHYAGMAMIVKQYAQKETRFLQAVDKYQEELTEISHIEILSGGIRAIKKRTEKLVTDDSLQKVLIQFEKETGLILTSPICQMLVRDVIKSWMILGNHCFLKRGLREIDPMKQGGII